MMYGVVGLWWGLVWIVVWGCGLWWGGVIKVTPRQEMVTGKMSRFRSDDQQCQVHNMVLVGHGLVVAAVAIGKQLAPF